MKSPKQSKPRPNTKVKRLKDLAANIPLGGVKFKHPITGEVCIWQSQWGYSDGAAGVWYKKDAASSKIFPLCLGKLTEALEFEVVD